MSPDEAKYAAAVMLAFAQGKKIEFSLRSYADDWREIDSPEWNWVKCNYRVKPSIWTGKIWIHSDGHTASYCKSDPEQIRIANGYRLIHVQEVQA